MPSEGRQEEPDASLQLHAAAFLSLVVMSSTSKKHQASVP